MSWFMLVYFSRSKAFQVSYISHEVLTPCCSFLIKSRNERHNAKDMKWLALWVGFQGSFNADYWTLDKQASRTKLHYFSKAARLKSRGLEHMWTRQCTGIDACAEKQQLARTVCVPTKRLTFFWIVMVGTSNGNRACLHTLKSTLTFWWCHTQRAASCHKCPAAWRPAFRAAHGNDSQLLWLFNEIC